VGGKVSTTGIAGLTLGGGLGWLRRLHGLSCDNLLSVDIVTADGQALTANETEHRDLFWGLRGGGGNFGVVTSFEYRLHAVGPEVMFCAVLYPIELAGDVLRAWRAFMAEAPETVSSVCALWSVPRSPLLPEEIHGRAVVVPQAMYAGPADEGEQILRPLRELGAPVLDLSGRMPYTTVQSLYDPFLPKGELQYYWKSLYLNSLGDEVIEAVVARAVERPSPRTVIPIWHLGGAVSRVGAAETAFGRRDAPFMLSIDSMWDDPRDSEVNIAWTRAFWDSMRPFSPGRLYLNFPGFGEENEALVRAAYGANYDRLVALKNKYDPDNLFRMNQNIKPTV
jgi:FAD/FMN-containing dehydrogenase